MTAQSVGEPLPRVDGRAKVTGEARYSAEVPVEGVAYAVMITSGIAKGRVESIDAADALEESGAIAVLTPFNAMKLPGGVAAADPGDRVVHALQDDEIHYSNQPIGLAVADTLEAATRLALAVKVKTHAEPFTVRLDDVAEEAKPSDIKRASGATPSDQTFGNPDAAFAAAAHQIDATYETPYEVHSPLEPHATTAVWSGQEHLTLYDASQGIFGVRKKLAHAFGLPAENVRVITRFVGGGFGCKGSAWSHVVLAALAARQLHRPVKLALTRQQMFGPVGFRPETRQRVALGAAKDGKLVAIKHETLTTSSRFDEFLEPSSLISRHLYACPNIETKHRLARIDSGTPTYTRAPGESSGSFALESAMDELAAMAGIDPLQLRLLNHADVDPLEGKKFSSKSLKACYARGAEAFRWAKRPAAQSATNGRMRVGWGMATATYPANMSQAHALARLLPDGSVVVQSGAVDIGGGTYTVMAQVAADAIGLPVARVTFELGDTELPEAPRSGGSQTAASVASAVMAAGAALKEKLIALAVKDEASALFRATGVRAEDGALVAGGKRDTFADVLKRAGGQPLEARGEAKPGEERKKYALHSFGAQFAEVEVDPDFGSVRVARMVGAFAGGRILNHLTARSQLMGGMVWGIGMALTETAALDVSTGRFMTRDLADYHLPTHADVPAIQVIIVDEEDAHVDPAGVKGLGELGICGAAAAIANAVFHATGKRVRMLPITPDRIVA